jgi:hypothetical protein
LQQTTIPVNNKTEHVTQCERWWLPREGSSGSYELCQLPREWRAGIALAAPLAPSFSLSTTNPALTTATATATAKWAREEEWEQNRNHSMKSRMYESVAEMWTNLASPSIHNINKLISSNACKSETVSCCEIGKRIIGFIYKKSREKNVPQHVNQLKQQEVPINQSRATLFDHVLKHVDVKLKLRNFCKTKNLFIHVVWV